VSFLLIWGTKKEKEDCELIANSIDLKNAHVIPDSPIKYLGALIQKCSLVIGNDSGPLHIAVSVGTPTLGIYGPTNPNLQGPYGDKNLSIVKEDLSCLYCNLLECDIGNICMTELSKEKIIEKVRELADRNSIHLPAI
jgi:ADP-heptose:LPS heptosyltransferase